LKKNSGYHKIDYEDENEILPSIRKRARLGGLNSLTNLAIQGPVKVAEKLQISLDEATSLCDIACKRLERDNLIPPRFCQAQTFLTKRQSLPRISTGCIALDGLLLGGIETGSVTEVYGGPGTGKSQLCFTLCVMLNENTDLHLQSKAIYIDTEKKFRPERLQQIAEARGTNKDLLNNISLARPLNTPHLEATILESINLIEKDPTIKLLVIDSLISPYRSEFLGRKNLLERQDKIIASLKLLVNASSVYDIAILLTNQIQSSVDLEFGNKLKPVGGNIIGHNSTYRIELKRGFNHIASIVNSPYHQISEARFMITERGVTDC